MKRDKSPVHIGLAVLGLIFYAGMPGYTSVTLANAQESTGTPATDTAIAGKYDGGKMWAFEYPPLEYLNDTYGFSPDSDWFEQARMSVLRIPGCSASFISPNGLVVTNHHCVRGRIPSVTQPGENLLDNGFYAPTLADERRIPGYYADQLIAIEDVTAEIDAVTDGAQSNAERADLRQQAIAAVTARIESEHADVPDLRVQIIGLYNGGRHSAYIFRRYSDVRLVFAVELQLGFFGGDGDNFTYPRYALDFTFLRIYDESGEPMSSPDHFGFSDAGVEEGDLVFVIGNPGSTSRQATVSQLEYFRDVLVDHTFLTLDRRLKAFRDFYEEDPETGEAMNLRNTIFSISNSQKAFSGRDEALKDDWLIERRAAAEVTLRQTIADDANLSEQFAGVFDQLADVQNRKRIYANEYGAFRSMESGSSGSATIRRAIQAVRYLKAETDEAAESALSRLLSIGDRPAGLERRLLQARLEEFEMYFGDGDPIVSAALEGRAAGERADQILSVSVLSSRESTERAVTQGNLRLTDAAVAIADAFISRYDAYSDAFDALSQEESELNRIVGQARFAVYGVSVPSDATFSPRFTDGVVSGYSYNGTLAPPYTTLYGLLDHYYSYGGDPDWSLPERWTQLPPDLKLNTPLNFISTSDTIGGNSGSPAVTPNLEIVGLNFDRNIEGLSRDYIYMPDQGRNIMVDMRSVKETLDKVYDADRIVLELTTGIMAETEAAADEIQAAKQ